MDIGLSREDVEEFVFQVMEDEQLFETNREFRRALREKLEALLEQNPRAVTFALSPEVLHRGMVKVYPPLGVVE